MSRTIHSSGKSIKKTDTQESSGESFQIKQARSISIKMPKINQGKKPKINTKNQKNNVWEEINYYQSNLGFLIPKATLVRMIKKISREIKLSSMDSGLRFTTDSINLIQEALENYLVCTFSLGLLASTHAKRVTIFPSDLVLIERIKKYLE